jgi:amino acid transporter
MAEGVESYGLHRGVLGPIESLAQSISSMAPSTSASLTIPLVFALAGNATWFVYLLATVATLLVGLCINRFAKISASPGSLYSFAAQSLPPFWGVVSAWSLLLAYLATAGSVAGGALYYARELALEFLHGAPPAMLVLIAVCAAALWIAFEDVRLSTGLMLGIEAVSIGLILIVLGVLLLRAGWHPDWPQFHLEGAHLSALGPALVLAMFSFVGFESATALGTEARDPLRTIPRVILLCAVLSGGFFMISAYAEIIGFRGLAAALSESTSPLHLLAAKAGLPLVGVGIDLGAAVSMFACVLACLNAASRVMLRMASNGILPESFARTSPHHGTPTRALVLCALLVFAPTAALTAAGVTGSDIYDWSGSLAVFGFLVSYALVAAGQPFAKTGEKGRPWPLFALGAVTVLVLALIAVYDLRSATDRVHGAIPWIFAGYLAVAMLIHVVRCKSTKKISSPMALQ